MICESKRLDDYLAATPIVDADHPDVVATARRLTDGVGSGGAGECDAERARRLFEWVRDAIPHTNDLPRDHADAEVVTCSASEVLAAGTGICYAKSHLLAALCRGIGVPAGFAYQRLRKDPPHDDPTQPQCGFELHGFNAVYLRGHDRWVRVDPRGNKPGVDAQFSLAEERLAFATDPSKGEAIDPKVYAQPLPQVVRALQRFDRLSDLWPCLPNEF